mmetsp:Transcript_48350/g.115061  ORF Transcript_48350/g.115061 Transcript_48350/m.115061 type:complete len:470 (+) Transcript_48350:449-1858(+)
MRDGSQVARVEPSVLVQHLLFGAKVSRDSPVPPALERPGRNPVARTLLPVRVEARELDPEHLAPLLGCVCRALLGAKLLCIPPFGVDNARGAQLCHSPSMVYVHPFLLESLDHRRRASGSADNCALKVREGGLCSVHMRKQSLPDRRHACSGGDFLHDHKLHQTLAVEIGAREDEFAARHARPIREPPRIHVKHRHHGEAGVPEAEGEGVGGAESPRVEHGRPVREQHSLRVACGAGGVAERGRGCLRQIGPSKRGLRGSIQQVLVAEHVLQVRDWHVLPVREDDDVLEGLHHGRELRDAREKRQVHKDNLVLRVVRHEDQLLRGHAGVNGVQHRAHARNRKVELHVAVAVPRDRRHARAFLDAELCERVREPHAAPVHLGVAAAVDDGRVLDGARHDLAPAVHLGGVVNQLRHQQRTLLHQAAHRRHVPLRGKRKRRDQAWHGSKPGRTEQGGGAHAPHGAVLSSWWL